MGIRCAVFNTHRDSRNRIIGYDLVDIESNVLSNVDSARVKEEIICGNFNVVNLTLTSDGRLVPKTKIPNVTACSKQVMQGIRSTHAKRKNSMSIGVKPEIQSVFRILGYEDRLFSRLVENFSNIQNNSRQVRSNKVTSSGGTAYVVELYNVTNELVMLEVYLLDDFRHIGSVVPNCSNFLNKIKQFRGVPLVVYGGSGLVDATKLFSHCNFESIDLQYLDTSNTTCMEKMFYNSHINNILHLGNLDTSNVTEMLHMFSGLHTDSLELSGFDTRQVQSMSGMFEGMQLKHPVLDLSSLDTRNVKFMSIMFRNCTLETIIFSKKFKTRQVDRMLGMFENAKINELDLRLFDLTGHTDASRMFSGAVIKDIKVRDLILKQMIKNQS